MKMKHSPTQERDWALVEAMGAHNVEHAHDLKLRQIGINLLEEDIDIRPFLEDIGVITPRMTPEEKIEYRRMKDMERLENKRAERDDRPKDSEGNDIYDGGDIDETGDPEQDAWLKTDRQGREWWARSVVRKI